MAFILYLVPQNLDPHHTCLISSRDRCLATRPASERQSILAQPRRTSQLCSPSFAPDLDARRPSLSTCHVRGHLADKVCWYRDTLVLHQWKTRLPAVSTINMATVLDANHPGGRLLVHDYLDIMNGRVVPLPRITGLTLALPPPPPLPLVAPGAAPSTRWSQVHTVLDSMWREYQVFVCSCNRGFRPARVRGEPWRLELRKRHWLHRWRHRGLGGPADHAVQVLRNSLIAAQVALLTSCWLPLGTPAVASTDFPPSMPQGCTPNAAALTAADMLAVATHLQGFRDNMVAAKDLVDAYLAVLVMNTQKHQAWLDNAIKIVGAVTGIAAALAPI